ncbi:uncharacterized protein LOC9643966 [Selaginella moellendorffii]|uniref:uncharacterized protein LOC9643966 n=1 Tax=Selaginella moellendorffii TaxID=88036 RepID=UPI000D1C67A8|nr:uncharacterized protein LOC9643966 [Selaginella moellendorffii]|eukprot:XP_002983726.2 uncharacterized protein LOC9643966 [Selaginella moellendorffii]
MAEVGLALGSLPVSRQIVSSRKARIRAAGFGSWFPGFQLKCSRLTAEAKAHPQIVQAEHNLSLEDVKDTSEVEKPLKVALICGGPSAERGISLNSARSVLDHLQAEDVEVDCYYMDQQLRAYAISPSQMYCNTPSDFDFKLHSLAQCFTSQADFLRRLKSSVDIVFPVIHGKFGEDGGLQELLESAGIPFVGTGSSAARCAFDKYEAAKELSRHGFVTIPSFLIDSPEIDKAALVEWFKANDLNPSSDRVVVKPAKSGSSIGVTVAHGLDEVIRDAETLLKEGIDDRIVVEVFLQGCTEFTVIILDTGSGEQVQPVALLPTEVELLHGDGQSIGEKIFNYRRKYLPTRQVSYHTPPRFPVQTIQSIRSGASKLFTLLNLRDFARVDGWLLPPSSSFNKSNDFLVVFSDVNLVSGMEQTSFLFQQAAQVGLSHRDVLRLVLNRARTRYPSLSNFPQVGLHGVDGSPQTSKRKVYVLFGGGSSERQVSLMSGTNVWLNLRGCKDLDVSPFVLAPQSRGESPESRSIWALPYACVLRHTVEEVVDGCLEALDPRFSAVSGSLKAQVMSELSSSGSKVDYNVGSGVPTKLSMSEWIQHAKDDDAIVFIAVHGDIGENGILQEMLEAKRIPFTGSGVKASRICMDKAVTGHTISPLSSNGVYSAKRVVYKTAELLHDCGDNSQLWLSLQDKLEDSSICVKPAADGCSTGVARLCCARDLTVYLTALKEKLPRLLPGSLGKPHGIIELPATIPDSLIFEPFIQTDDILVCEESQIAWEGKHRWVEITAGVIGKKGAMHALHPSITLKESGDILSLEEKFQGGTGVNLTPPPPLICSEEAVRSCRERIELVANTLQLEGFARIDAFMNVDTGEVIVIEVNTVPGMTPSTVLIHQVLAETTPLFPREFFRAVVDLGSKR